ncbi:MAG TPA: efflux RND transporter permease subunit [Methylomirabilota bacterium]|nr:efflux RND transporter permease subunit [Methylomirabilota bacterium]
MKHSQSEPPPDNSGILAWFARNHVAANLLMAAVVIVGLVVAGGIKQEVFPSFLLDRVEIEMEYRGASPEEVERSVVLPIESEIRGMELVRRIESVATEGRAQVMVEILPGFGRNRALQEVTAAVQRISLFPDETEAPVISLDDGRRRSVMSIAVYGDLDERTLVDFARGLEDGLLAQPEVALVEVRGARRPEIHVEIPQAKLRALGLTLGDVAQAIDSSALDVPAGTLRTPGGDILLKTTERRDFASQFKSIAILTTPDGAKVRLSDIASVTDTFEETEREAYFNGKRAVFLSVYSSENQSPLQVATAVRKFTEHLRPNLPPSVDITLSRDRSEEYQERLQLLLRNGTAGLLLVLLALALFLELRVAFWTAIGIPISILGSLVLLPVMGATINMISLFAFIVTLGIVVDDAIVVGEDIFHKISSGFSRTEAAVAGVKQMTVPVVFAVSTNIIAFLPLLFVPGEAGRFFHVLPAVVIAVFTVSLVECLLILPAHLAFTKKGRHPDSWFSRFDRKQTAFRLKLDAAIERFYRPLLALAIRNRILTVAVFLAALLVVVAYVGSGRINFAFRPTIETDFIQAEIAMPSGTPVSRTRDVVFQIEAAARRALELAGGGEILVGVFTAVADRSSNHGEVSVTLVPQSKREITSEEFANLWREQIPVIPDVESIFFDYLIGPGGEAEVDIELSHPDVETLRAAAEDVAGAVGRYPGVEDVRKGFGREMPQFNFEIKPAGRSMGITARELGRQIRGSFYGAEALRQPRDREELRVMVKLPEQDRHSMSGLQDLLIRAPNGGEIPLRQAALVTRTNAPVRIERVDGARVINVTANVLPGVNNANRILSAFSRYELPDILAKYPGLRHAFEGDQREQREALVSLSWGLTGALFAIFAIMASLLRSYAQAAVILLTIPWSLAGAVAGHVALGFDLSVFSMFGMIALCGMVVNGGFVLAITRRRFLESGTPLERVTAEAALRRFRPILLTAVTTFLGLAPMIFETSIQALFLVPMAISLGVGTIVSAMVILILVPVAFVLIEESTRRRGESAREPELPEQTVPESETAVAAR